MSADAREFDIVLFGATGFVGRLTALHLAAEAGPRVRIALAGRSLTRLQDVAGELGPVAKDWPLIVADATDEQAVTDLAARARVVVTTVGPYVKYGVPLAAACAEAGTHYCDLTGEVLFVHRSIAANHETARRTGARIVHACGFDSIPSDLGVWLTAEAARADGAELGRTHLAVRSMKGGFSGGTIDSARTQVDELKVDKAARRVVGDPWALADGGRPPRPAGGTASPTPRKRGGLGGLVDTVVKASPVKRDADNGHFTGPFVMAAFNTRVVARSASLLGYGDGFRYVEYSDYGAGPVGAVTAGGVSVALGVGLAGFAFGPTRALLDRVLPKPGEGPSEEAQATGRFRMEVTGQATNGARYRTTVAAP
ncbi:MAG TPA: saccharopine dehydrogenase NADP-binding domain-containing protein, partial [Ornithinibacter sp.]|nr:saccharopine dehydrogenase NADP-binding domain-containing protein [Ornithinibacter sp.]